MASVFPNAAFDAEAAAQTLKDAMKGLGTNEADIIAVLVSHSNEQRQAISSIYTTLFGEDLIDGLKSELGGDFEQAVVALMTPPRLYDARELKKAMKGSGTDEGALIEILVSRNNDEINAIKEEYEKDIESDVVTDIDNDTDGNFQRLLVSLCQAGRDESDVIDNGMAQEEAQELFEAGEEKFGTDESKFNQILATRNFHQLRATFQMFKEIAGCTIEESIDSELSGSIQDGFKAIVNFVQSSSDYFAERIRGSVKGGGTDDDTLIRCIVSRSEVDLQYINTSYQGKYEVSLQDSVEGDCGGEYKRLLIGIITPN